MTPLTKPISRVTAKTVANRQVVLTIAPCGAQQEARIGLRLLGSRKQYVVLLSDIYRMAALWHGQKEASARREARKNGIPWSRARLAFNRKNSIEKNPKQPIDSSDEL